MPKTLADINRENRKKWNQVEDVKPSDYQKYDNAWNWLENNEPNRKNFPSEEAFVNAVEQKAKEAARKFGIDFPDFWEEYYSVHFA